MQERALHYVYDRFQDLRNVTGYFFFTLDAKEQWFLLLLNPEWFITCMPTWSCHCEISLIYTNIYMFCCCYSIEQSSKLFLGQRKVFFFNLKLTSVLEWFRTSLFCVQIAVVAISFFLFCSLVLFLICSRILERGIFAIVIRFSTDLFFVIRESEKWKRCSWIVFIGVLCSFYVMET